MTTTPPAPGARLRDLVAARVRDALEAKNISGSELARQLGVNQPYVWRRLNGEVEFSLTDLEGVARVLRISALTLLSRPKHAVVRPVRSHPAKGEVNVYYHPAGRKAPASYPAHRCRPGGRSGPGVLLPVAAA